MGKKSSTGQKALYSLYAGDNRAAKNKVIRATRHSKLHPNDTAPASGGGRNQNMEKRPSKLEAQVNRAVTHDRLFGQDKLLPGRDLSTAKARSVYSNTGSENKAALKSKAA